MSKVGFGKYADRSPGWVLLHDPGYAEWILGTDGPALAGARRGLHILLDIIDTKPWAAKCRCGSTAARRTTYGGGAVSMLWCESCDPYSLGAREGSLWETGGARMALWYAARLPRDEAREVVRGLCRSKGMASGRITQGVRRRFFCGG